MTATVKDEIAGARTAKNTRGTRSYTRAWRVISDAQADDAYTVGSAAGLPSIGTTHPSDAAAYCFDLDVQNDEPWTGWTVTASYSDERTIDAADPTNDEVLIDWSSEIYQEVVYFDTSGNAVLNSAGDYFVDPVPTRDATHLVARIRANVSSVPSYILSLQNTLNNGAVTIGGLAVATGLARVCRFQIGSRQLRNAVTFYPFSFEVHIHADGWVLQPLDCGFRKLVSGSLEQIKDGNGDEVTQPALLDGSGGVLASPGPATAVFGSFNIYPSADLTTMPGIS